MGLNVSQKVMFENNYAMHCFIAYNEMKLIGCMQI